MILDWKRRLLFWGGAVCLSLVAILFAVTCEKANDLFHKMIAISPYFPLLVTPLGLVLIVIITRKYFSGSQGSGIPQAIASLDLNEDHELREQVLSLRIVFGKIILTIMGLLFGASVGREGPTVQIGASIMHRLGSLANFSKHDMERGLILAGSAAGVAAAFNTPLAGIVFAIEELGRSFEKHNNTHDCDCRWDHFACPARELLLFWPHLRITRIWKRLGRGYHLWNKWGGSWRSF